MDVSYHSSITSRIPYRGYRYVQHYKIFSPPLTDGYAVPFTLNRIPGSDPFFRDIQPVSNEVNLPFWIEHAAGTTISTNTPFTSPKIWVRLPKGCTDVDIYRKNPRMTADRSDGNRTFDFFDDFLGSSVDTAKWSIAGSPDVSGSILTTQTPSGYETLTSIPQYNILDRSIMARASFGLAAGDNVAEIQVNYSNIGSNRGNANVYTFGSYAYPSFNSQIANLGSGYTGYHIWGLIFKTNGHSGYVDRVNVATHTTYYYNSTSSSISITARNNTPANVDWIALLKYQSP